MLIRYFPGEEYCATHGFSNLDMDEIPPTFFEKSILQFPKQWVGPSLSSEKDFQWLSKIDLEKYYKDLTDLRNTFSTFAGIPRGHELARDFLNQNDRSLRGLDAILKKHKFDKIIYGVD